MNISRLYNTTTPAGRLGRLLFLATLLMLPAVQAADTISVWQTFPWLKEAPHAAPQSRAMMPAGQALVQLADAEYEPLCLSIRNDSDETLAYMVDTAALTDAADGLRVEVRASWVTPIAYGNPERPPLSTLGADKRYPPKDVGDPLLLVTPDRPLYVPAGESRSVWITLYSDGVEPGVYEAPVVIRIQVRGQSTGYILARVDTTVQVWPFALPPELDIACYHWDYGFDVDALTNMRQHKVNTFMIADFPRNMTIAADGTVSGDLGLDRIKGKRQVVPNAFFVGSYGTFTSYLEWTREQGIDYMSPAFKDNFAAALRFMVAAYKSIGLGYDDFMLQTIDEANSEKARRVIEMGQLAREIDPQIRWALTVMASLDEVKAMAPYHDCIMIRGEATWNEEQTAFYRDYQAAGNEVWQFKQTGMERGKADVHMLNRLRQWRTWLNRWSGSATFVYTACPYNYYGDPIPVRQWEAIRESNEDYQYFALLRDLSPAAEREAAMAFADEQVMGLIGPTAPGTGMIYAPEHPAMMLYPYQARQALAQRIAATQGIDLQPLAYEPPWIHRKEPADFGEGEALTTAAGQVSQSGTGAAESPALQLLRDGKTTAQAGEWIQDEYRTTIPGLLEHGVRYRVSFDYEWPAEIETGSVQIEGIGSWPVDRKKSRFSQDFVLPESLSAPQNFVMRFKEFRLHQGDEVVAQVQWQRLSLAVADAATDFAVLPDSATGTADTSRASGLQLVAGKRYRISLRYRSDAAIQRAVNVVSTQTRKVRGREVPAREYYSISLPNTGGEWWYFTDTFTVNANGLCRLDVGARDYQVGSLETADVSLRLSDADPTDERLARLRTHQEHLARIAADMPKDDPLREIAEMPLDSARDADVFEQALMARPFASWQAESPRRSAPKSAVSFGIAPGLTSGPQVSMGDGNTGPVHIGVLNLTAEPLAFMVQPAKGLTWSFVESDGTQHRPDAFLEKYGWCEWVLPPGATGYLRVANSGDLALNPMDGRLPGLMLPVSIVAEHGMNLNLDEELGL